MYNQIIIQIGDVGITSFSSFEMVDNVLAFGRQANITFTKQTGQNASFINNQIVSGNDCSIYIDNNLVLTGYIASVEDIINTTTHNIKVKIIDKVDFIGLANPVKSGKSYNNRFIPNLFSQILKDNGYKNIKVNTSNFLLNDLKLSGRDQPTINVTDTIADFFDRYTQKIGGVCTSDADGNILITKENRIDQGFALQLLEGKQDNNILSRTYLQSIENRFSEFEVQALENIVSYNTEKSTDISAIARDIKMPLIRKKIINVSDPIDSTTAKQYARFLLNLNKSKSNIYNCEVVGFYWDKEFTKLIKSNQIVNIRDYKINGQFIVQNVNYKFKEGEGSTTNITCLNKGSITPDNLSLEVLSNILNLF